MIKIGLTGSIGMGKSTVTAMFSELGAATWSADDAVHRMYEKDGAAVAPIAALFPEAVVSDVVDRKRLAMQVLNDPEALKNLENIVHPLVAADREAFMAIAAGSGAPAVVFDIPLLFENGLEPFFDVVIVVSASADAQRARVLTRPGMSEEKLDAILSQQMADAEKRSRADYVIATNGALEDTRAVVKKTYEEIIARFSQVN